MFSYYLRLGWLSLRKTPVLSLLMIAAIGIGIGVCMTIITVYTLMANDPIPAKSRTLYTYMLDNHLDVQQGQELDDPNPLIGYRDAMNIRGSDIASDESLHYQTSAVYKLAGSDLKPFRDRLRLASSGFFSVFDVPFVFGGPYSAGLEEQQAFVVVLGFELNEKLFGGENSVGQTVEIEGNLFDVVGVAGPFSPVPRYFETDGGAFEDTRGAFIPFSLTPVLEIPKSGGGTNCISDPDGDGFDAFLEAECTWIHHWVVLDSPADRDAYLDMLTNYTDDQRQFGRFQGPYQNRIYNVMEWLEFQEVINPAYVMLIGIALMFLVVCLLNTNGLLFAKFSGRRGEISVRRALGCSRTQMFYQHLVEIGVIGVSGGILGLLLAGIGLISLRAMFDDFEHVAHLNTELVVAAVVMSTLATLVAGLYPAWRICQVPPASYLKSQ